MKKIFILLLIISAFSFSFYFSTAGIAFDEMMYGSSFFLFWTIPFAMILVNTQMIILPHLLKSAQHYSRFKSGFEMIFLALTAVLLTLHMGILLVASGMNLNLLLFVPLWVGIVFITAANTLPRFVISSYETEGSTISPSHSAWNRIVRPGSSPLMIGGGLMLLCVLLPESFVLSGFFIVLALTLLGVLIRSYRALTI